MNCDRVRPELTDLDRGELSAAEAEFVARHVAGCKACAAELRRLRRVRSLFTGATAITPSPASSARLLATLQAEMDVRTAPEAPHIDLWSRFRRRYEASAAVRRFTFASIGLHAAAAAILAVALSTGGPGASPETVVSVDGLPVANHDDAIAPAGLAPFDAATAGGVRGEGGRSFPNAATAARLGVVCDPQASRLALAATMGSDAELVADATARGLAWLASQQRDDGSYGAFEDTALAVLAQASAGRSSGTDAGLGRAVARLEADVSRDSLSVGARAEGIRALVQQYAVDFDVLSPTERDRRRALLAEAGRKLTGAQAADGSFGATSPAVVATVAAAAALTELRVAGVLETGHEILAAQRWMDGRRSQDGLVLGAVGADAAGLSAALVAVETSVGHPRVGAAAAERIAGRSATSPSVTSAAAGIGALRAIGKPVAHAVRRVAAAQAADGSFADGRRTPVAATASALTALSRAVW